MNLAVSKTASARTTRRGRLDRAPAVLDECERHGKSVGGAQQRTSDVAGRTLTERADFAIVQSPLSPAYQMVPRPQSLAIERSFKTISFDELSEIDTPDRLTLLGSVGGRLHRGFGGGHFKARLGSDIL